MEKKGGERKRNMEKREREKTCNAMERMCDMMCMRWFIYSRKLSYRKERNKVMCLSWKRREK